MANILFVNSNLHGHINPTFPLASGLVKRGNRVCFFCSEIFEGKVRETGAEFRNYGNALELFLAQYRPTDRHPFFMLIEYVLKYDEAVLPELVSYIREEQFDAVVCDSIFGAGYFLKQILQIPVISSHSSFAMSAAPVPPRMLVPGFHPQLDECYRVMKRICSAYQIPEIGLDEFFIGKGDLNIVYTTKEFNGNMNLSDEDYVFSGPSLHLEKTGKTGNMGEADEAGETVQEGIKGDMVEIADFMLPKGKKVIYISLGTINTNFPQFFKLCIQAFQNTDYFVVMSVGNKIDLADLGGIPDNFIIRQRVPQLEVLKHATVFISHAGFNSVNESLFLGVPVIAIPMTNDQFMVAKRLVDLNAGISAKMDELTEETLQRMVESVITNETMYQNCKRISITMQDTCQKNTAAERIEKIAGKNNGTGSI